MFELVMEDEYGSRSMLGKNQDPQVLVKQAKKYVCDENMENALTVEEQKKEFTHYFVEFFQGDELADNVFFGGKKAGRRVAYVVEDEKVSEVQVDEMKLTPRFYIGEFVADKKTKVKKEIYAEDRKNKVMNSFSSELTTDRNVLYIVKK